jgi:hypothetical protein
MTTGNIIKGNIWKHARGIEIIHKIHKQIIITLVFLLNFNLTTPSIFIDRLYTIFHSSYV